MTNGESISAIRARLEGLHGPDLERAVRALEGDSRAGVHAEVTRALRREACAAHEGQRLRDLYSFEEELRARGASWVAGVDEVGRGAVAGPLTVAACVLQAAPHVHGLDDSKRLTPSARARVAAHVRARAVAWSVVHVSAEYIDAIGIVGALRRGASMALSALGGIPDHVVVDGTGMGVRSDEIAVVKGDAKVAAIAAASVLAKTSRDAVMSVWDERYPEYSLGSNKGYGSCEHMSVVSRVGPSPVHRRSFLSGATDPTLF